MTTDLHTADERLYQAALRWAISEGWQRTYVPQSYRSPDRRWDVAWSAETFASEGIVWLNIIGPLGPRGATTSLTVPVPTVSRALDVLAALGVIPAHMSTMYGAGRWSARMEILVGGASCGH